MSNFRDNAKEGITESETSLNQRVEKLQSTQKQLEEDYDAALKELEEYIEGLEIIEDGKLDQDSEKYKELKEKLETAGRAAFKNSAYVARSHQRRMTETKLSLSSTINIAEQPALTEIYHKQLMDIKNNYLEMFSQRMNTMWELKTANWQQSRDNFNYKKEVWNATVAAIYRRGAKEWGIAKNKIGTAQKQWLAKIEKTYQEKGEKWEESYSTFLQKKSSWVQEISYMTSMAGAEKIYPASITESAAAEIEEATKNAVTKWSNENADAELITSILTNGMFEKMLESAKSSSRIITNTNESVHGYSAIMDDGAIQELIKNFAGRDKEELEKQLLIITALKAMDTIEDGKINLIDMVDNANESTQAGIEDNLTDAGYTYSETRNEYTKEVLEDVTAFGGQDYTNARVEGYNDYETPDELIDFSVKVNGKEGDELTKDDFAKMASSAIERKISYAMEELKNIRERIFGKPKKASEEKEYLIFEKEDKYMKGDDEKTGTITRRILKKDGEFNKHVGYAPQLRNMPDNKKTSSLTEFKRENILFEGSGQMGIVMLQFMRYQMMEGRGWSEFAKPWDERRMFDDDAIPDWLGLAKGWTIGGAVDLVTNIALSATGLGAFAPLIMLASDAVDMASELAQGRDLGEAVFDFAKDSVKAGISVGLSAVPIADKVSELLGGSFIADGIGAMASNVVTTQANSLANAVNYSADGGWDFDTDGYLDSTFGVGAIASYAGSFAGAAVTTGLTGTLEGFSQTHAIDVKKTAQFFGNTATMGTQYLISGETSMNVLNFDMFGLKDIDGNTISRGLVELKFGKEGITTAAGTGGVDMSYNAIKGAIEGFDTFATQQKIRYYEATGKTDFADDYTGTKKVGTSLRMNYSFGDGKQIGQLNSILDGTDTLRVGYIGQDGYTKKIGGGREVDLATLGIDSDINTRLKAGIVLGHEAYRDGIERTEKEQFYESVNATAAHTAMALRVAGDKTYGSDFITSDANLSADVFNYSKGAANFEQYVFDNYDWRGENLLLKANTQEDYQNEFGEKWYTPLGNSKTVEEVDAINKENKEKVWETYKQKQLKDLNTKEIKTKEEEIKTIKNEELKKIKEEELKEIKEEELKKMKEDFIYKIENITKFAKDHDYIKLKPENIYRVGCKMMTAKYVAEQLTGEKIEAVEANERLMEENVYADGNMLYTKEYAEAIETLTNDKFNVEHIYSTKDMSFEKAMDIVTSDDIYVIHIRYGGHSELVYNFNLGSFAGNGYISSVDTTNSWQDKSGNNPQKYYERTKIYGGEVDRWDVFKVNSVDYMDYGYSETKN